MVTARPRKRRNGMHVGRCVKSATTRSGYASIKDVSTDDCSLFFMP
jgi:hypothetical protein